MKSRCMLLLAGMLLSPVALAAQENRPGAANNATPDARPDTNRDVPVPPKPKTATERAVAALVEASISSDPGLRSNALEAMHPMPDRAMPMAQKAMGDPNAGVRFAGAVTAGLLKLNDIAPAVEPLLTDSNPSVRAAALYALYAMGRKVDLTPMAPMLMSSEPSSRGNAAMLLGMIGDPSAVVMLKQAADAPMPRASVEQITAVRIQIAEAVANLGDDSLLDAIRAGVYSQHHEIRVLSITTLGAIADRRMEVALEDLLADPDLDPLAPDADEQTKAIASRLAAEIRLAAAGALARMSNMRGSKFAVDLSASPEAPIRYQAAWVLGWLNDAPSLARLEQMLDDMEGRVRVAAAGAFLRRTAIKATP